VSTLFFPLIIDLYRVAVVLRMAGLHLFSHEFLNEF
jgi:hypothetical protein